MPDRFNYDRSTKGKAMAELENPYRAPASHVADVVDEGVGEGAYVEGGRTVASSRGWAWIREGYGYFRRQTGMWVVLTFIFFALLVGLQLVPVLGGLAFSLLMPVFVGGLMTGCQTVERGGELELAHLFAGFRRRLVQLALIAVIGGVLGLIAMLPLFAVSGMGFLAMPTGSPTAMVAFGLGSLVAGLVSLALLIPINMAVLFAPALVMLQNQSALRAIAQSFRGCLKNIVPFLIYGAILFALAIVASIPAGLGWLVLLPVVICSVYAAYRDIFFQR
jgi:uncharacterized membrane protein